MSSRVQLSAHLTLDEVTRTGTGLDNQPDHEQLWALLNLARFAFEPLRMAVGPMQVTSGLRTAAVNAAVGGASKSQHLKGEALDVKPLRMASPAAFEVLAREVAAGLAIDQAILYHPSRGGHIHLSHTARRDPRGQLLYAPAGGGYVVWESNEH